MCYFSNWPVEGNLDTAERQTINNGFQSPPLTFGVNISGANHRAERCVSGEREASGALLHGQSTADGLGSLCWRRAMVRYGR